MGMSKREDSQNEGVIECPLLTVAGQYDCDFHLGIGWMGQDDLRLAYRKHARANTSARTHGLDSSDIVSP